MLGEEEDEERRERIGEIRSIISSNSPLPKDKIKK
jgi:hypothetical protein